ncbi:MAG: type II toxin-antitoxin system HicB family antitoxin [Candidatus Woesearchaeota archaeon]
MKITVILEKQEEGGFTAFVPSLPGCISEGDTKQEALKNIKEAIELYLEPDTNELVGYCGEKFKVSV